MKELSIEEKARRYDEAKYIMKEYLESGNAGVIAENTIKKAFPELTESEDEKIRKDIVTYLKSILSNKKYGDKFIEDWIAWLEKQGEQKSTDNRLIPQKGEYYVCIKDYYSADGKTTNIEGQVYKSPCDGYINNNRGFGLSWINSCTENFFRPVKKEDWIVCEQNNVIGKPLQCKEFMSKLIQKNIKSLEDKGIVPNFRLWDIFDAKDGDILFAKGSYFKEYTFIYSGMTNDNVMSTYCGFDMVHNKFDTKLSRFGRMEDFEAVSPTTKEQRDTLLKAMTDAGYEWDAEQKQLKKIEHNTAWSEEDDYNLQCCIAKVQNDIDNGRIGRNRELLTWLKSLKHRSQWKPSERQKEALLWCVVHLGGADKQALGELLEELNKL